MVPRKLDYELIRRLYTEESLSTVEISARTGWAKASIRCALKSMGIVLRGKSEADAIKSARLFPQEPTREWLEDLMNDHDRNASSAAESVGVNYWTFRNHLRRHGIPVRASGEAMRANQRLRRVKIPVEEAIELSNAGVTYEELAQKYGVTYSAVAKRLKEAGYSAPPRRRKGKYSSISFKHRKIRLALNIDACEICDETRALDVAHIKPRCSDGPDDPRNCLVLCALHHRCFDSGTLTEQEFVKIATRVREAEQAFGFGLPRTGT
jgi:DNA-binding protein Fis/uncharacterized protein (DUF433 family)